MNCRYSLVALLACTWLAACSEPTPANGVGAANSWSLGNGGSTGANGQTGADATADTGPASGDDTAAVDPDAGTPEDAAAPGDDTAPADDSATAGDTEPTPDATTPPDTTEPAKDTAPPAKDVPPMPDVKPDNGGGVKCEDEDGDTFGKGCSAGLDCDDYNPFFNVTCPDCSKGNIAGCPCKGKSTSCYTGDPKVVGKGLCMSGIQYCQNGFWGECSGDVLPDTEKCDGKDNDCDGQVDEGVKSSCGTCDMSCNQQQVGKGTAAPFDLNSENANGVGLNADGEIVLDPSQISVNLKYIWIANSPQSTVSKIDCKTAQEVGRFQVCSDPSRTSVDLQGNVWVGCRGDGKVAKIMSEKKYCSDKNGNGIIETSTGPGLACNGQGCDECVKFVVQPDGGATVARGAAVDKDNHAWIGFWNSHNLRRLHPDTGAVVDTINIGCHPYGLVVDQKGVLWAQGAGCGKLIRVDVKSKQVTKIAYGCGAYGLNVDKYGNLWVASGGQAGRYNPSDGTWKCVGLGCGGGRGVATSNDGFTYVACDSSSAVAKINSATAQLVATFPYGNQGGGKFPVGIALDFDGFVWAVNQGSASATKIDPKTGAVLANTTGLVSPYTYSDMTGYTLNYFTAPKGQYTAVFFGKQVGNPLQQGKTPVMWTYFSVDCETPAGTSLTLRFRAADSAKELETAPWVSDGKVYTAANFPIDLSLQKDGTGKPVLLGQLLQVEISMLTDDKAVTPAIKSLTAKSQVWQK